MYEFFNNMTGSVGRYLPSVLGAILLLLVAWVVASLAQNLVQRILVKFKMDEKLAKGTEPYDLDTGKERISSIGKIIYLLVFILFLPSILDRLGMSSVSQPITNMMNNLLGFIPNLIGACLVLFIGWFVAKIVRDLIRIFLTTINIDKHYNKISPNSGESADLKNQYLLADVLSKIVFGIILIPVITIALDILNIQSLTQPIVVMLNSIFLMIPNIFVAIILLVLGFYIAKFVSQILESLLQRMGIESIFNWADEKTNSNIPRFNISKIIGNIVQFLIMLFITVEALNVLNLNVLNTIGYAVIGYIPLVLSGILIIGAGIFGGYFVEGLIKKYAQSPFAALIAKYIIIVFSVFMTLEQIKFASTIVNLAFLLVLGGMSVAFALAFGLGGREFASRQLEKIERKIEEENNKPSL